MALTDLREKKGLRGRQSVASGPLSGPTNQEGGEESVKLPDVKSLMVILGRGDGAALSKELEKLLLKGEQGYEVMHQFFHQADLDHEKIVRLTHDPQPVFGLLRVVALYPEEVAELSRYLMKVTKDRPESWIRREIFNFLPVFLYYHQGRFPEVRRDLEKDILDQIEMGGAFFNKVFLAMRDLDFRPPAESFLPILLDPSKRESHRAIIGYLAQRQEEGLKALERYLKETKDFKDPAVGEALRMVASLEAKSDYGVLQQFLEHPDPNFRRPALFAFFSQPRDWTSLPLAVEFLNSADSNLAQKRSFLSFLAEKNDEVFHRLARQTDDLKDEKVKQILSQMMAGAAMRKDKKGAGPASAPQAPANPGQAPSLSKAEAGGEIEALMRRIAELEKALAEASALAAKASAPAGAAPGALTPGIVPTASARELGSRAKKGMGEGAKVVNLLNLFRERNGPALSRELGALLARGEKAYPTLYDFCLELDADQREALLVAYDYRLAFSLMHLAMLHGEELAGFAHYFYEAGKNAPPSALRKFLFTALPDFLRYHQGRFPNLAGDLKDEILRRLREGRGDLQMFFMAMEALGYRPPVEIFDPLLAAASSHAEVTPVVLHLESRNDPEAVNILSRNINRNPPGNDWKFTLMLNGLGKMTNPEAEQALLGFTRAPNHNLCVAAVQAYFTAPRDESSLPLLEDFLNSKVDLSQKRLVVARLRQKNHQILAALKADLNRLRSEEVRKLVRGEGIKPQN